MAILTAVFTDDYAKFLAELGGGVGGITHAGWNPTLTHFRVGEGGWIDTGSGPIPRTPDTTLRLLVGNLTPDIDALVDPGRAVQDQRYATDQRGFFEKALIGANFSFISPYTLEVTCTLLAGEFNNDGFGNNPEIWEIGLFCAHPTIGGARFMMAYATFPKQIKTGAAPLTNKVRIKYKNK